MLQSRGYLADPQGQYRVQDVSQRPFTAMGDVLARGYTPAVSWLRLEVSHQTANEPFVLRIRPGYLDEVRLYWQDAAGQWQTAVDGDRYPYAQRSYPGITPSFLLYQSQPAQVYYLRLKTTSTSLLYAEAESLQHALRQDVRELSWQIVY